ncbi:MAG: hypothetical protein DRO13_02830 [Thermoprotei archaeon]|nr:MAG: hypothetical protein DRO13_02830 [Thermoprotei archaeon]
MFQVEKRESLIYELHHEYVKDYSSLVENNTFLGFDLVNREDLLWLNLVHRNLERPTHELPTRDAAKVVH